MVVLLLAACASEPIADPVFVRDGVVVGRPVAGARPLPGERWLLEEDWRPGEVVAGGTAPVMAECVPLFSVDLGDVATHAALGGAAPDTALAFSPDGSRLAVGTFLGELLVLDGWTGEVLARRRLSEALVKQVAWSADGETLYAAEQSPDAFLHALTPDLAPRWHLRLADLVGTSAPPPGDDLYGVYTLPAAYGLTVLADGSLLVAAVHAWNPEDGVRRNRSQLLRVDDGEVVAGWPAEPASVTLLHPRVGGERVVVPVGRSATGPAPDLPIGGVQVLSLPDLAPVRALTWEPLAPFYSTVFAWEAVDVEGDVVLAGLSDGRVYLDRGAEHPRGAGVSPAVSRKDLGTPVLAGEVPVGASIGHAMLHRGLALVQTSTSTIPWGAADPALRPPAPHPNANALWALDDELEPVWTWRGPHALEGMTARGDVLVAGAGPRRGDDRRDLFGALVFDLRPGGEGSGQERLRAFCATGAPVFFRQAIAPDGRVAVVEFPWLDAGDLAGAYRVTVLR